MTVRFFASFADLAFDVAGPLTRDALERNPILVTALNPAIGYEKAAAIAKKAYRERRPVMEVALEDSGLDARTLKRLLDPAALVKGGRHGTGGG